MICVRSLLRSVRLPERDDTACWAVLMFTLALMCLADMLFARPGSIGMAEALPERAIIADRIMSILAMATTFIAFMRDTAGGRPLPRLTAMPAIWVLMVLDAYYVNNIHVPIVFNLNMIFELVTFPMAVLILRTKIRPILAR